MKTTRESVGEIFHGAPKPISDADLCSCGFYVKDLGDVKGSFAMELLLWILFFPIGIVYSIWRLTGRTKRCPRCGIPFKR
jgi:hypothetical protein